MSRDVRIRTYREGDGPAIRRGFEEVFGHSRSAEEWAWKFPEAFRAETVMIAESVSEGASGESSGRASSSEVLAHFAAVPVTLQVGGRTVRAGQVVDVYSTRRQGVFLRLVERFYEELCGPGRLELIYGFPGTRHFRLGVRKLRYSEPLPVPFWTRAVDLGEGGFPPSSSSPVGETGGAPERGGWWDSLGEEMGDRPGDRPEAPGTALDELWQRAAPRYPVTARRDRGWIERRFTGRPKVRYRHRLIRRPGLFQRVVRHRGRPAAWAVVRQEGSILHWADLVWDGHDPQTLVRLDEEVTALARQTGATELRLWLGNDPQAAAVLDARGWRRAPEPQELHVGAVSFLPDLDALDVCRRLYLTMGDADLV